MKHEQTVGKGGTKSWVGFFVAIGVVLLFYGFNLLLTYFVNLGLNLLVASIIFWGLGIAVASALFYRFAIIYKFELGEVKFTVSRIYLHNPRMMLEILTREIVFLGTPEEAKARWPEARISRAVSHRASDPIAALVYIRGKDARMLLFEPNEDMKGALLRFIQR